MHLQYSPFLIILSLIAPSAKGGKTSIYIDKVPAYSSLEQCAQSRVSAIVRAQASGCGDDMALTSFSCFCIDSSSYFNSVLSTDVAASCQATVTMTGTRAGRISQTLAGPQATAVPVVVSVLDVFRSYCLKTTELADYKNDATATVTITQALPTTTALPTSTTTSSPTAAPSTNSKQTPVAAIAAPVSIGILVIAGALVLFFWLRRRRATKQNQTSPYAMPAIFGGELHGSDVKAPAAGSSDIVKYRYELENREVREPVEMDGVSPEHKAGWTKAQM